MGNITDGVTEYTRDGLTFDVTDRGDPEAPAVLLLHGFPEDRQSWDPIADRLVEAGLRTLAPDQRGYSPRARPTHPYPQAYALPELVDDAVALIDAAGLERVHLVGHDWGGGLAWTIAGAHPDRVATLTVLSTPHPAAVRKAIGSAPWQFAHSSYLLFFQLPRLPERALHRRLDRSLVASGLTRAEAERYAGRMREPGALTGALGWYRAIRYSRGAVHRCRVPTTFVWGRHDVFLGRQAAETTGAMVLADYRFVEVDEGHWLPERQPDLCAAEIAARVAGTV
ncbi:MAG: alpha/beta fold hydrolase [Lapillicoccus sp.]